MLSQCYAYVPYYNHTHRHADSDIYISVCTLYKLNNLLKTLQGCYFRPGVPADVAQNAGEFIGYFIIFQVGNSGEVAKHLQRLPRGLLDLREVQFAVDVWAAIRTENYAHFFKLLRRANLLQACLMHRYVTEMRLCAMRRICKVYATPGKPGAVAKTTLPLDYFYHLLLFESEEECVEFMQHCGIELISADTDEDDEEEEGRLLVVVDGQDVDDLMPLDKNNHPIYPVAWHMAYHIEQSKLHDVRRDVDYSVQEICRGLATKFASSSSPGKLDAMQCNWLPPIRDTVASAYTASSASSSPISAMQKSLITPVPPESVLAAQPGALSNAKKKVSIPGFLKKKYAPLPSSPKASADVGNFSGISQGLSDLNKDNKGSLGDQASKRRLLLSSVGPLQSQRGEQCKTNEAMIKATESQVSAAPHFNELSGESKLSAISKPTFSFGGPKSQYQFECVTAAPKEAIMESPPALSFQIPLVDKSLVGNSHGMFVKSLGTPSTATDDAPQLPSYPPPSRKSSASFSGDSETVSALTSRQRAPEASICSAGEVQQPQSNRIYTAEPLPPKQVPTELVTTTLPKPPIAEVIVVATKPCELVDYYPNISQIRSLFLQSLQEQVSLSLQHRLVASCFAKWYMQHRQLVTKVQQCIKLRFLRFWQAALARHRSNKERFTIAFSSFPSQALYVHQRGLFRQIYKQRLDWGRAKAKSPASKFLYDAYSDIGSTLAEYKVFMESIALVARYKMCIQLASYSTPPFECTLSSQLERLVLNSPSSGDRETLLALRRLYDTNPVCTEYRKQFNVDDTNVVWDVLLTTEASRNMVFRPDECPVMNSIRGALSNKKGFLSHFPGRPNEAEEAYLSSLYLHNSLLPGFNKLFAGQYHCEVAAESTRKNTTCFVSVAEHCSNRPCDADVRLTDSNISVPPLSSSPATLHVLVVSEYNSHRSDLHTYCSQQVELIRYQNNQHKSPLAIVIITKSDKSQFATHICPGCSVSSGNSFVDKVLLCLDSVFGDPTWRAYVHYSLVIEAPVGCPANTEKATRKELLSLLLLLAARTSLYPLLGRLAVDDVMKSVFCSNSMTNITETPASIWPHDLLRILSSGFHSLYEIKQHYGHHVDFILRFSKLLRSVGDQTTTPRLSNILLLSKRESAVGMNSSAPADALTNLDYIDTMLIFLKSAHDCICAHAASDSDVMELSRALDMQFISLLEQIGININAIQLQQEGLAISSMLESLMDQRTWRDTYVWLGMTLDGLCSQCKYLLFVYFAHDWLQDYVYYTYCLQSVRLLHSDIRMPIALLRLSPYLSEPRYLIASAAKRKYEEALEHPRMLPAPQMADDPVATPGEQRKKEPRSEARCAVEAEKENASALMERLEAEILRGFGVDTPNTLRSNGDNIVVAMEVVGGKEEVRKHIAVTTIEVALMEARAERAHYDRVGYYFQKYK
ncbi:hypothetical protein EON65_02240 [archaeon]|nr:MAG: hypothetical protein EON65_02240 [archaeon]